jgi:hypothetical protein
LKGNVILAGEKMVPQPTEPFLGQYPDKGENGSTTSRTILGSVIRTGKKWFHNQQTILGSVILTGKKWIHNQQSHPWVNILKKMVPHLVSYTDREKMIPQPAKLSLDQSYYQGKMVP